LVEKGTSSKPGASALAQVAVKEDGRRRKRKSRKIREAKYTD